MRPRARTLSLRPCFARRRAATRQRPGARRAVLRAAHLRARRGAAAEQRPGQRQLPGRWPRSYSRRLVDDEAPAGRDPLRALAARARREEHDDAAVGDVELATHRQVGDRLKRDKSVAARQPHEHPPQARARDDALAEHRRRDAQRRRRVERVVGRRRALRDRADAVVERVGDQHPRAVLRDRARMRELRELGVAAVAGEARDAGAGERADRAVDADEPHALVARVGDRDRAVGERATPSGAFSGALPAGPPSPPKPAGPAPATVVIVPSAVDAADAVVARVGDQEAAAGERRDARVGALSAADVAGPPSPVKRGRSGARDRRDDAARRRRGGCGCCRCRRSGSRRRAARRRRPAG